MKEYYYSDRKEKFGPVSLEELIKKDLKPDSLVWWKGLIKWRLAKNVDELQVLFKDKQSKQKNKTVDNTQKSKSKKESKSFGDSQKSKSKKESKSFGNSQKSKSKSNKEESTNNERFAFFHDESKMHNLKKFKHNKGFFRRPLSFQGRITHVEFSISLFVFILLVYYYIDSNALNEDVLIIFLLQNFLMCFFVWFYFAQAIKRIHDLNAKWWWILILPLHIYLIFTKSYQAPNEFGTKPEF